MTSQTPQTQIDTRLKLLSHSSVTLLHTCPRKYELNKTLPSLEREESIHLYFGAAFGAGVQEYMVSRDLTKAYIAAFINWTGDIEYEEAATPDKSLWHCLLAIEHFATKLAELSLGEYEVVYYNSKPAIELGFRITLPNGYYYRGYLDALLQHRITGHILAVDFKTTGAKYSNPAKYQNSPQVMGYSVVVDKVLPDTQNFEVMYFEYMTGLRKFVEHSFVVGYVQRARWLKYLLGDIKAIDMFAMLSTLDEGFPMYGESCTQFGSKTCPHIDYCTLSNTSLGIVPVYIDGKEYEAEQAIKHGRQYQGQYDIEVTLDELIQSQLERG